MSTSLCGRKGSSACSLYPCRAISHSDRMTSEDRVRKGAEKLEKFLNAKQQGRLDGFFAVKPKTSPTKGKAEEKGKGKGTKRKVRISMSSYRRSVFLHSLIRPMTKRRTRKTQGAVRRPRGSDRPWSCYKISLFTLLSWSDALFPVCFAHIAFVVSLSWRTQTIIYRA